MEIDKKTEMPIAGYITVRVYRATEDKWYDWCKDIPNLLTTDGRDFFHAQCYTNTAAGTRGSNFMAISSNVTAPAAGDTVLAGEITVGGLARADADLKTHTDNTNSTTIDHTWTATASHTNVQKVAMFNAASGGIMTHEGVITVIPTLNSGDKVQVQYTVNLG